ncbi:MAG: hypothetical protein JWR90_2407 [Marmoricola sp.]|jgi:hypothetical protein|nr:hypothetical protein [Marmoricola sp.]
MSMAGPKRVAVLRLLWAPGPPVADESPQLQWSDEFFHEVFQASNGWSLRDYWLRASFGLLQLEFDFSVAHWWRFGDHSHAELKDNRNGILAAARQVVEGDNGVSLAGFDAVIAFVHAPPSNAGACGGGAVFDQGGSMAFFQHELGHVLGFEHSFGPLIPPPDEFGSLYNDPYCVMGYTGLQSHALPVPPAFASLTNINSGFWTSERRPAAASLYRRFTGTPDFVDSGWVTHAEPGARLWVAALSEVVTTAPVLAVLPLSIGHSQLTIEYRTQSADDAGVAPGVVIHSIGAHDVGVGRSEVDPPWFETVLPPVVGASADVLGVHLEVVTVSTGSPGGIEVQTSTQSTRTHIFNEGDQEGVSHTRLGRTSAPLPVTPVGVVADGAPHTHLGAGPRRLQ